MLACVPAAVDAVAYMPIFGLVSPLRLVALPVLVQVWPSGERWARTVVPSLVKRT